MKNIFKACDIRGVYGQDLHEKEAYAIARAAARLLDDSFAGEKRRKRFVVGADVRPSSVSLKEAVIHGLLEEGIEVLDIGIVPTPVFYFAKRTLKAEGGIMITASHNPPRFNGMKIALGGMPITEEELDRLRELAERIGEGSENAWASTSARGSRQDRATIADIDVLPAYKEFIVEASAQISESPKRPVRVAVDCGNGCYSEIAPAMLRALGFEVLELFCEPDGTFPNRDPNSAVAENLIPLGQFVRSEGADMGVAFDGDGDRVAFTDENGAVIPSDKVIVLLLETLLKNRPGEKVVYDIKCSRIVPETILRMSGIPLMEKSGHTFLKRRMIVENAIFGGELSGHYFYRMLGGGDDGLYSAILLAHIAAAERIPLSMRVAQIPSYETTPDLRVPFAGDPSCLDQIAAAFPIERISRLDGIRVDFGDGWGLARISVTEPVITLRFEARNRTRLAEIAEEFLRPVPQLRKEALRMLSEHISRQ